MNCDNTITMGLKYNCSPRGKEGWEVLRGSRQTRALWVNSAAHMLPYGQQRAECRSGHASSVPAEALLPRCSRREPPSGGKAISLLIQFLLRPLRQPSPSGGAEEAPGGDRLGKDAQSAWCIGHMFVCGIKTFGKCTFDWNRRCA